MTAKKLSDLITGDRFYFCVDNKKTKFQITEPGVPNSASPQHKPRYNIIENGVTKLKFDQQAWGSKDVVFLRNVKD